MPKIYIDSRGWRYCVKPGLNGKKYKPHFFMRCRWERAQAFPWCDTEAEAQADLDAMAVKLGWKELENGEGE